MGIPSGANLALTALFALAGALVYAVLPLVLLPRSPAWALLLVPWTMLANTHWALIHEALHNHLHPRARVNGAAGRLLGILFGGPFLTLRSGHLAHHRFNGTLIDRPEAYVGRPGRFRYYFQLLGGLHLGQLLSSLAVLLPAAAGERLLPVFVPGDSAEARDYRAAFRRSVWLSRNRWGARLDALLAIGLLAFAFAGFGRWWPLLLASLAGRAFLVSFMDNSYHYGLPLRDFHAARNARAPWAPLWLHFTLHGVHHRSPETPWRDLPALLRRDGSGYDADVIPMAFAQLRGPIAAERLPAPAPGARPARRSGSSSSVPAAAAPGPAGGGPPSAAAGPA